MVIKTVTEAKAKFSSLLERVSRGEEVIVCRAGKPIAVLEPYRVDSRPRRPGSMRGKVRIAADFDELPRDISRALGVADS